MALSRPTAPTLAVSVTLVLWASAFVGIRRLGPAFSPGALTLGRLVVGSAALGVLLLRSRWRPPTRGQWLRLVSIGVLWFGVYNVTLNAAEHHLDAGTSAMLIQLSPIMIACLAVVFLGERGGVWLVLGIAVAFAGVGLIAESLAGGAAGAHDVLGVLLCLVAAVAYSISLVVQKPAVEALSAIQVTWVAATVGAVVTLPFAGSLVGGLARASPADVAWLVYLGVFPTAVAFTTYAYALRHMSASSLGVTTYLVPPLTVLLSWWLLGQTPPVVAYVGGALCLLGVGLARRRPAAPRSPASAPLEPPAAGEPAPAEATHTAGPSDGSQGSR